GFSGSTVAPGFSPDSKSIAVTTGDNAVRLVKIDDGNLVAVLQLDEPAEKIRRSADGYLLATTGDGNTVRVWRCVWGIGSSPQVEVARVVHEQPVGDFDF